MVEPQKSEEEFHLGQFCEIPENLSTANTKNLPQYVLLSLAQGAMMGSRMRESFMSGSERGGK
jgi:hypothetical protein